LNTIGSAVGPTRILIHLSAENPILTSSAQPEWTINHGYFTILQSHNVGKEHDPKSSGMTDEKRFAWSLVSASHTHTDPVDIAFSIVDPRDLEALWRE
jgi:hypothetical protein